MKSSIAIVALFAPAMAWGVGPFLSIDETAALVDGATMTTNPKVIEYVSTGVARYPNPQYDAEVEGSEKYVTGEWFIKEPELSAEEEQLENAQELYEERKASLRSVFCEAWDRTLCWDLKQLTFERQDADCEGDDCALSKTQTYRFYRQGRGQTRTIVVSQR